MRKLGIVNLVFYACISITSCKKYLSIKPDTRQHLVESVSSVNNILNNNYALNESDPVLTEIICDDYYIPDENLPNLTEQEKAAYIWEGNMYNLTRQHEWGDLYHRVYLANVCISGLEKIERVSANAAEWDQAMGSALFTRARAYQQAAYLWAKAYDPETAGTDPGIPLRANEDFNEKVIRSTVEQTYRQIIEDFSRAAQLLPFNRSHQLRPSRAAAFGYLARTFLSMRKYDSCLFYANEALLNYSNMFYLGDPSSEFINEYPASVSFKRFNPEVIFDAMMVYSTPTGYGGGTIDTTLKKMYAQNDLRRKYYFDEERSEFIGDYSGYVACFSGITTSELRLMAAECKVRTNQVQEGLDQLNTLNSLFYEDGNFEQYQTTDPAQALKFVLVERRKQLVRRGVRWMDIKRLNKEGAGIVLKRIVNGQPYVLTPNSPRYALPIPEDVIKLTGIAQN